MNKKQTYKTEWDLITSLDTQNMSEEELKQKIQKEFPKHNPLSIDQWEQENIALVNITKS